MKMAPPESASGLYVYLVRVPTINPDNKWATLSFPYESENAEHALEQYNDDPMVNPEYIDRGREMVISGPYIEVRNSRFGSIAYVEPQDRHVPHMDPSYERYWTM